MALAGRFQYATDAHLMQTRGHLLGYIRRTWAGLVRLWPASRLSEPLPNGLYRVRNRRSGAFAAIRDANEYSDMISLLPHMGLTGGEVVRA